MRSTVIAGTLILLSSLVTVPPAAADEITRTYEFELHDWHDIDATDGPVTLHRIRLEPKEGRLTKSTIARPYNQEYLQVVLIQLEYTNESSGPWKARINARWLDEEGRVIDGMSANEKLAKKAARRVTGVTVSTLKYGLERAETLEVTVHFRP